MGSNTLNARSSGQTILDTFFNDFNTAFGGDFIGRNSSGVPTSGQNLGTAAVPWGTIRGAALILNGSAVDTSKLTSPANRVISGKTRSTSNQPAFLTPNGAAASFILKGATTNLLIDVNGTPITVATDITKSSLTVAPNSNNTALVNDALATGQHDTRLWGEPEHFKKITIDTVGSNISNLVGKFAAFKIGTEYFYALVESATVLSHCRRGYFYDSSLNPLNRVTFSDNDTITLMSLGWVFVDQDTTTVDVTYTNPFYGASAPNSPATGDYWYDLANKLWKRYDGATFQIVNRVLIGNVVIDTANCVAARCMDFYADYRDLNTIEVEVSTTEIAIMKKPFGRANVAGQDINFGDTLIQWNITTNLAGSADMYNATEQSTRVYYLYVKDTGAQVISDISPYYRHDLFGMYHPHNPWRCVGAAFNDGSSNIVQAGSANGNDTAIRIRHGDGHASSSTHYKKFTTASELGGIGFIYQTSATDGAKWDCVFAGFYEVHWSVGSNAADGNSAITKNDTEPTTDVQSSIEANVIAMGTSAAQWSTISSGSYFKIGDQLRAKSDVGVGTDYGTYAQFQINKSGRINDTM